jgi:hypothetical protein
MKIILFVAGLFATVAGVIFHSDTECIIASVFITGYVILDRIDKKLMGK